MLLELSDAFGLTCGIFVLIMTILLAILRIRKWSLWWLLSAMVIFLAIFVLADAFVVSPRYDYDIAAADSAEFAAKYGKKGRIPDIPAGATEISGHHGMPSWEVSYRISLDQLRAFIAKQGERYGTRSLVEDDSTLEWESVVGANGANTTVQYAKQTGIAVGRMARW